MHCLQRSNSSHIVPIRDLVPNLYSRDTDIGDFRDMYYLDNMIFLDLPCDFKLVIL